MRKKLIALIREANKKCKRRTTCHGCEVYGNGSDCVYMLIADHLAANGVTIVPDNNVGKWISVTERKPTEEDATELGSVLVYTTNNEHLIVNFADVWRFSDFISHWMTLPQPPKEG